MKAIAVTIQGLEKITQLEIKEILKLKSEVIVPSRVLFSTKSDKDLAKFIYNARSISKAYLLLDNFKFSKHEEILDKVKGIKFPYFKESFVVRCERSGNHGFNSVDVERLVGKFIYEKYKINVDLNNPHVTIFIDIVDDNCFIGVDFSGIKLSKRNYRIKLMSSSINPLVAYSMVRLSGVKTADIVLDPFCKSGEIPIECALFLNAFPNCFRLRDKLLFSKFLKIKFNDKVKPKKLNIIAMDYVQNSLRAAEINSKLGSVNKFIKFSRLEIEWLDTKFKKASVSKIITFPPFTSNNLPIEIVNKIYKELFYQAEYVLKNEGLITIISPKKELVEKYAFDYNFKKTKDVELVMGNNKFNILIFKKA